MFLEDDEDAAANDEGDDDGGDDDGVEDNGEVDDADAGACSSPLLTMAENRLRIDKYIMCTEILHVAPTLGFWFRL